MSSVWIDPGDPIFAALGSALGIGTDSAIGRMTRLFLVIGLRRTHHMTDAGIDEVCGEGTALAMVSCGLGYARDDGKIWVSTNHGVGQMAWRPEMG